MLETITSLIIMSIAIIDTLARTEPGRYQIVSGALRDEIAVTGTEKNLLLRPIFIKSDSGEREVLCYVPQNLSANDNEPFNQIICELLGTGIQESFSNWSQ
jgi:hypothetical protein